MSDQKRERHFNEMVERAKRQIRLEQDFERDRTLVWAMEEITRLRAKLAEVEGQEPVGYGYFHKETAQMDGWLEITEADSEGHAWPDTHEPKPLYTHPAPAKVPEVNFDDVPVSVKELTPEAAWICGYYAYREAMLEAQGGE